jgi:hypothetical protein
MAGESAPAPEIARQLKRAQSQSSAGELNGGTDGGDDRRSLIEHEEKGEIGRVHAQLRQRKR